MALKILKRKRKKTVIRESVGPLLALTRTTFEIMGQLSIKT
jgi:hypothetical protein